MPDPVILRVTEIGEYVRHHSCARRLKFGQDETRLRREIPFYSRLFNALDPVLREAGAEREDEVDENLRAQGLVDITRFRERRDAGDVVNGASVSLAGFLTSLAGSVAGEPVFGREVAIEGRIGNFHVQGRIDFVLVEWTHGTPRLRLVECKASRRDKTYQRIQAAVYLILARQAPELRAVDIGGARFAEVSVEALVARIDEGTEDVQPVRDLPALPLEVEVADVQRLLAQDGQIANLLATPLEELPYSIEPKCDHCKFNVVCLPEAGRLRSLELIGIDPSTCRVLRLNAISTLTDLVQLDLGSPAANAIRSTLGFSSSLSLLQALARARTTTLPGGSGNADDYEVSRLPWRVRSQLPKHEIDGHPVVRVYLGVHYDYVENRIGSLAAHVAKGDWQLVTSFDNSSGQWRPDPLVRERRDTGVRDNDRVTYETREMAGFVNVIRSRGGPWSSNHDAATGQEAELLQGFFTGLINAVAEVAQARSAAVHFYVWSRSEMAQLIEACLRSDTRMLRSLQELLGCREPLEQLIFSCVGEEVATSMALGWTGQGMSVVSSLRWYGQRFHWTRNINGEEVQLDRIFNQDIFDFKTRLDLTRDGSWALERDANSTSHSFEIRSRFFDSLTAPYWRASWGVLTRPETPGLDAQQRNQLERYYQSAQPNYLETFLLARLHALRWIEGCLGKNDEIDKPRLNIPALRQFTLGITTPAESALDFLRLDYHVKLSEWITAHLAPPANRVSRGATLPLRNLRADAAGHSLTAEIDTDTYGVSTAALRNVFTGSEFARLSPHSGDPEQGQTIAQLLRGGATCVVDNIDWDQGIVRLTPIYGAASRYIVSSRSAAGIDFSHATLDESVSDFVSPKVDSRLEAVAAHDTYQWLDTTNPRVPPQPPLGQAAAATLETAIDEFTDPRGFRLQRDQKRAITEGLSARMQLLQGPPGTGKTQTTAAAILARCWIQLRPGDVVLVGAQTHTAVNELLGRIAQLRDSMSVAVRAAGGNPCPLTLFRVDSEPHQMPGIEDVRPGSATLRLRAAQRGGIALLGGTTSALLKLARALDETAAFGRRTCGFQARLLVVDEASMLVFAHFLSLATLVRPDGQMMLAGDHRQLSPIVAHNWEEEDRYPVTVYQPYVSAYEAIKNIKDRRQLLDAQVTTSSLNFTFRLPEIVRHLISPIYARDNIDLDGRGRDPQPEEPASEQPFNVLWRDPHRLHLLVHNEDQSAKANPLEVEIVRGILEGRETYAERSVVIITPHRAQRSLLVRQLGARPEIRRIDTVEKMQGGECPIVIVSATASDTSAITRSAGFILDLNRANVAFSRAQERLIVVCSKSLLDNVPADLENYESALLWKSLRELCTQVVSVVEIGGHRITIYSPR